MKEERLDINGVECRVRSLVVNGKVWIHLNGETWSVDGGTATGSRRARGSKATQSELADVIVAPMPGKITKVNVKAGESVKAEQILIVMEAMKMEYNLSAPRDAKVKTVSVGEGMQVELNQALIKLEFL